MRYLSVSLTHSLSLSLTHPLTRSSPLRYAGPLSLRQLMHFVHHADSYLCMNPSATVALICDTGCDKSCLLAAAYLLHSGTVLSTQEATEFVQSVRSPDARLALRTPSLSRYLLYYETLLRTDSEAHHCNTLKMSRVRVVRGIPNLHSSLLVRGCSLYCKVSHVTYMPTLNETDGTYADTDQPEGGEKMQSKPLFDQLASAYDGDYASVPFHNQDDTDSIDMDVSTDDVTVRGDVTVEICDGKTGQTIMCVSFHTAFVDRFV